MLACFLLWLPLLSDDSSSRISYCRGMLEVAGDDSRARYLLKRLLLVLICGEKHVRKIARFLMFLLTGSSLGSSVIDSAMRLFLIGIFTLGWFLLSASTTRSD